MHDQITFTKPTYVVGMRNENLNSKRALTPVCLMFSAVKRKPFVDVVVVPGMMEIIKLSDRIRFFHGNEITKEPLLCYLL